LSEVQGVFYGKVSPNLQKHGKKLEEYLCVTLETQTRSIDLYLLPEQVNLWYIGLAQAVKAENPKAIVLSVGRFFWRKLNLLGTYQINDYFGLNNPKNKKKGDAFAGIVQAMVAFKNSQGK
jgi:hypothetical protein